ncbi:MAG: leucine--tRNA ligase, partial [Candidatus Bathyarchaeota archaeon]|nr:leucine--tRNA ligase [Candidatus Bathyarchaeota archaeon]
PASTLRPETIYGVTNLWVNPEADYVKARVNGKTWITSKPSCQKLRDQGKDVRIIEELHGNDLERIKVFNPVTGDPIEVLMGEFVDPDEATGVVMSVPAHDPYDYFYVRSRYSEIESIQVIEVEGKGRFPAKEIVERLEIKEPTDPRLAGAVKELYNNENKGKIISSIDKFGGMNTVEAREKIEKFLSELEASDSMYELSVKPVHCRCGTEVIVKVIEGQWFINYSDPRWKAKAKECVRRMTTFPDRYKNELPEIIDWLAQRPCARRRGLGTPFPFERGWVIEALSDSTIYMAFFIVAKYLNAGLIREDQLTSEFFDFVFSGQGSIQDVSKTAKIPEDLLRRIRGEFDYWYPLDLNAGGKEHKTVHFPFFIFNHVAIFPENYYPKGIFVNWHLVAYGQKMSKHLGNVVFFDEALDRWGADTLRFYLLHGSNQWRDFDWRDEECQVYQKHLERFQNQIKEMTKTKKSEESIMDSWLKVAFNIKIQEVTDFLQKGEIRKAIDAAFFGVWNDFEWYRRRTNNGKMKEGHVKTWLRLLTPFIPHICEENWRMLGEETFISVTSWPEAEKGDINTEIVEMEEILKRTMDDVKHISELTGCNERLCIYTFSEEEFNHFNIAKDFLSNDLGFSEVNVFRANDKERYDPEKRGGRARPKRPGIFLE